MGLGALEALSTLAAVYSPPPAVPSLLIVLTAVLCIAAVCCAWGSSSFSILCSSLDVLFTVKRHVRSQQDILPYEYKCVSVACKYLTSYLLPAATVELKACIISWFCPYLGRSPSIYRNCYRRDGNTNDCVDNKHVATLASTLSRSVIRVAQRRLKCDGSSCWIGACRS